MVARVTIAKHALPGFSSEDGKEKGGVEGKGTVQHLLYFIL
jgi:hypothetical protein